MVCRAFLVCAVFLVLVCAAGAAPAPAWPEFRGPGGTGIASGRPPLKWDEQTHIAWKTPIPGAGWSSPVCADGRIWLTVGIDGGASLRLLAVDAETGVIGRDIELFAPKEPDSIHEMNSPATPTPVIADGRVYVSFGNMGNACVDANSGEVVWRNTELKLDHMSGAGSSPVIAGDLVVLNCDGTDVQYIAALRRDTGALAWKTNRSYDLAALNFDLRKAFCTPTVVQEGDRTLVVTAASYRFYSYDARTGRELWFADHPGFNAPVRPQVSDRAIYFTTGWTRPVLMALRRDPRASGDVSGTHILWQTEENVPRMAAPLLLPENRIAFVDDDGVFSVRDAAAGTLLWKKKLTGKCWASPVFAGGRVYVFSRSGETVVFTPGEGGPLGLSRNLLDKGGNATPAVLGDSLILRTETHLYRIAGN